MSSNSAVDTMEMRRRRALAKAYDALGMSDKGYNRRSFDGYYAPGDVNEMKRSFDQS